ncbi:MAG: RHS repeat-associated core domain-containing protein [Thermoleophilia bacterium]
MRESKTVETPQGTTQTKSVWDGSALAAEQDSDGTVYRYLWGPDRTPLSVAVEYSTGATETFAYHTDALGSVVAMTDSAGSVVARYAYGPYGACTLVTGDPIAERNPLRYRAYYADAETGMFYLPARYYDPATYRFLSQDPAPPSAGDPLSLNAYAYCLGDPVGASDPSGAVSDIEAESWSHYYKITGGNRSYSEAASYRLRHNQNYRRRLGQKAYAAQARVIYAASARRDYLAGRLEGRESQDQNLDLLNSLEFSGHVDDVRNGAICAATVGMLAGGWMLEAGLATKHPVLAKAGLVVAGSGFAIGAGVAALDYARSERFTYVSKLQVAVDVGAAGVGLASAVIPGDGGAAIALYGVPAVALTDNFVD